MNGTDPLGLKDELDLGIPGVGRFASTVTGRTGGAVPAGDPLRLMYERLGREYPTAPRGGPLESLRALFGGPDTQPEIMGQLLKMRPLMQEERAQQQAERQQRHEEDKQRLDVAKHIGGRLDKFFALPRDQQAILAPWIEQEMTFALPRIGITGATPETIRGLLARPDLATTAKMLMGVEQMTKSQAQQAEAAFGAAPPDKYLEAMTKLKTEFTAQADTDLRTLLPVFVHGNGTPGSGYRERLERQGLLKPGAPIPYELFLRGVRDIANSDRPGLKELAGNRFYRDAFYALMKDEEFLASIRVQAPKAMGKVAEIEETAPAEAKKAGMIEEAKMAVTGLPRGPDFNRIASELFPGVASAKLTGTQVGQVNAAISERGEKYGQTFNRLAGAMFPGKPIEQLSGPEKERVNLRVREELGYISAQQGAAQVTAGAEAKRKLEFFETHPNHHLVDRKTGQFVDRLSISLEGIRAAGGEGSAGAYALLDKDETRAYRAILEGKAILDRYADLSTKLVKAPGANLAQRFDFTARTFLGIENIGVELSALQGSVLRLAGAMQGSRIQLSDQDRKSVEGMVPTGADSTGTALQRLSNSLAILEVMQQVALGSAPNTTLHKIIAERLTPKRTGPVGKPIP